MKKSIIVIVLIFGSLMFSYSQSISGNGNVISQKRDVANFLNIDISDGVDLLLTQSNDFSVVVKTDENIQNLVKTVVIANTLKIYVEGNIRKVKTLSVFVSIDNLEILKASDGSDVKSQTVFKVETLNILCSNGSDIDFLCNAEFLECNLKDGSDANIKGQIKTLKINANNGSDMKGEFTSVKTIVNLNDGSDIIIKGVSEAATIIAKGGSDVSAYNFKVKDFSLAAYDGSDAIIFVTNNLNIKARQGSDVIVKGNPLNKNILKDDDCDVSIR